MSPNCRRISSLKLNILKVPTIFNISEITTIAVSLNLSVSVVLLVRNGWGSTPYLVVALATLAAYVAPYVRLEGGGCGRVHTCVRVDVH